MKKLRGWIQHLSRGDAPVQQDGVYVNDNKGVFIVADAFGDGDAGLEASRLVCDAVRNFLEKEAGDLEATLPFILRSYFSLSGNVLYNAIIFANQQLWLMNKKKPLEERVGVSLLVAYVDHDLISMANIGACSAWLYRKGLSTELVTPRSYSRMMDPFHHDSHEGMAVPMMAIGMTENLEPEIIEYKVHHGDWILMHTDGVRQSVREKILDQHRKNDQVLGRAVGESEKIFQEIQHSDNAAASLLFF